MQCELCVWSDMGQLKNVNKNCVKNLFSLMYFNTNEIYIFVVVILHLERMDSKDHNIFRHFPSHKIPEKSCRKPGFNYQIIQKNSLNLPFLLRCVPTTCPNSIQVGSDRCWRDQRIIDRIIMQFYWVLMHPRIKLIPYHINYVSEHMNLEFGI